MAPAPSSSSSHAISSSTTSPSSSASSKPVDATPKNDPRTMIVAVILSIAAAFLIGYIIYLTLRLKRRQSSRESSGPYHGSPADRNHPAAHISPFASASTHPGGVVPRFQHTPGSDMRIAVRRPDGAWHFADSRTPFTPSGVSDIDVLPSPSSSTASFLPWSSRTNLSQKEVEVRKGYGRGMDADMTFPPPAYTHSNDSVSSIDHQHLHTDR